MVIATIHQPSSELFELFDRLYLLVDGCTVYNGSAADSIAYFGSTGYQCPSFMNPTDYFMKQLAIVDDQPESRDCVKMLMNAWSEQKEAAGSEEAGADAKTRRSRAKSLADVDFDHEAALDDAVGVFTQLSVLCRRNWLRMVRDVIGFRARIGSTLFITIVIGLIFLQLDRDQKGVQDFTGAMFFIATNQLFSSANPEFITVPLEIPLVMREHNGGLYHSITWYAAKNVSELPAQLLFPALFLVPCYFMVGFGLDARLFFSFFLIIALLSSCATGLGYMVSCLARRVDVAPIMGILFILPSLLFGGLSLNSDSTPSYFIWLQPLSPIKYGFHALMRAFSSRVDVIDCLAGQRCIARTGADVLESNSVQPDRMWADCLVLMGLNVAFRLVGALVLWRRSAKPATV